MSNVVGMLWQANLPDLAFCRLLDCAATLACWDNISTAPLCCFSIESLFILDEFGSSFNAVAVHDRQACHVNTTDMDVQDSMLHA